MKRYFALLAGLIGFSLTAPAVSPAPDFSLAGQWRFQLDRADVGISQRWFAKSLTNRVELPGTLTVQGIGDDISTNTPWTGGIVDESWFTSPELAKYRAPGTVKVPFWLQPEKYYAGAAWFQRDVDVPADWADRRVVVFLERAHWETRVWLDDRIIGTNRSLSTPHEYDLGKLTPGKHTITIRVDNRRIADIGENSHSISDHTQGNWNGIVGKIELRSTPLVWIEELQLFPMPTNHAVRIKGKWGNESGNPVTNEVIFTLLHTVGEPGRPSDLKISLLCASRFTEFDVELKHGDWHRAWNEFEPHLPTVLVSSHDATSRSMRRMTFGFREISSAGTQFMINSNIVFFRGTLECAIFPKTGHPPMETEEWRRIIKIAKSHGLNLLRFHSWCPPEAAFQAADELGMYFQIETCWPNQSTSLGDGKPVDQWIYEETDRILKYYGNHPSFVLMAAGNEPGGKKANDYLAKYVAHYRALDPRRLWTSGAGWPQLPENQFHVTPDPRIQKWGAGLASRINALGPETTTDYRDYIGRRKEPVISHEIGQWCAYPNFDETPKYTGYLKAKNFEIFRERLETNGLGALAKDFLLASGKLQTLCYKEEIESALRTPGMGGFQLLDLHDFPGQGTALVGVLDSFWEEKGYVSAKEYSSFCNSTVPLARLAKRVFTTDETLEADIELAHYGSQPMREAMAGWKLVNDDGKTVAGGMWVTGTNVPFGDYMKIRPPLWFFPPHGISIPVGGGFPLGKVSIQLQSLRAPAHYKLVVAVGPRLTAFQGEFTSGSFAKATAGEWPNGPKGAKRIFKNDWDIWVYPAKLPPESGDVLITSAFDDAARAKLASGGNVLLTIPAARVRNFDTAPVKLGFSSIFWNTAWTQRQPPTTLGILCDPKHPALADFPTEFHSNWQWWYLIHRAGALRLDLLPRETEPIVRVIDDWTTARPLGLVVDGRIGAGKIIICGFDLTRDADDPVSRQMRASLSRFLASERCNPGVELSIAQIRSLIAP